MSNFKPDKTGRVKRQSSLKDTAPSQVLQELEHKMLLSVEVNYTKD